jgi:hypothetical protein
MSRHSLSKSGAKKFVFLGLLAKGLLATLDNEVPPLVKRYWARQYLIVVQFGHERCG